MTPGSLAALLAAMVSVQVGAVCATHLFGMVGPAGTTTLRLALAAPMLAVALRPFRGGVPAALRPWVVAYGVSLGGMNVLFYLALSKIPLGLAVALEFFGPLGVTLAGARGWRDAMWLVLAVAGLWLLLPLPGGTGGLPWTGVAAALGAGVGWAAYIVTGQKLGAALGMRAAGLGTPIAALVVAPFGVLQAGTGLLAPAVLLRGLIVALLSSAIPYSLEMLALARLPRRLFGQLMSLEPAVGALAGLLLLGQTLSLPQWLAIGAIMAAALGAARAA